MINAAARGALSLEKLEAMTCVCSVGLDMIAVPGDTPASTIAAIIADEAAIGMVNSKTTAVRIIPGAGQDGRRRGGVWRPVRARAHHACQPVLGGSLYCARRTHPRAAPEPQELKSFVWLPNGHKPPS